MISWIIRKIQEAKCTPHEWELLGKTDVYFSSHDKFPYKQRITYRCKKCGVVRKNSI